MDSLRHNQKLPSFFSIKKNLTSFYENKKPSGSIVVLQKDFAHQQTLVEIFSLYNIQAVVHFAALIEVGQSVKHPFEFYQNNVIKTIQLIETMINYNIKKFIFSSSCAVYGAPKIVPIPENHPKNPISPYGKNKLIVEMYLEDCKKAYGLESVCLRYFNAAGALNQEGLGEQHIPETHLIPLALQAAQTGKTFYLFGDDYETKDGSCVRDYLHVQDLATAHYKALEYLKITNQSCAFNLGTGTGYSVKQVITAIEKICNKKINLQIKNKREGDPATLIANPKKAKTILNWQPEHSSLENIIKTAFAFASDEFYNEHRESKEKEPKKKGIVYLNNPF